MKLGHNPTSFLSAYISMMRNMFLTSSISIATLGYSQTSKLFHENGVKLFALIILVYSICYGTKASVDFNLYLDYMETNGGKIDPPYNFLLERWRGWTWYTYAYLFILVVIAVHFMKQFYRVALI